MGDTVTMYQACRDAAFKGTVEINGERYDATIHEEDICSPYRTSVEEAKASLKRIIEGRCQTGELGTTNTFTCAEAEGIGEVEIRSKEVEIDVPEHPTYPARRGGY